MRISLRTRLTLIYGSLFLIAGVVLLGTTFVLFNQQIPRTAKTILIGGKLGSSDTQPSPSDQIFIRDPEGNRVAGPEAQQIMKQKEDALREAAQTSLLTQGGIALALIGGAAAGLGWLVAARVLGPLERVTETARRIAAAPAADRGLHERIALRGPKNEVKELADTFDTMVERLDRSFDGQRRFIANASHELRTPLTVGRALVEVAMHRRAASEDVRELGENLLQINSRHERLISGLLMLANSDHELIDRRPVDLADVVGHVVAQTAGEAKRADVAVQEEAGEAPVTGDALLLERLVYNLVENAIRHNAGDRWVNVASRSLPDGRAEVEVSNSGPVIPEHEVPVLFEPFHRQATDTDRLVSDEGAGLGLSIVRSIARAHGGTAAARARDDGGLVVTVTFAGANAS